MKGKGGRLLLALSLAAALLAGGVGLWRALRPPADEPPPVPGSVPGAEVPLTTVDLYFADAEGERLAIERREVAAAGGPEELVRSIVSELVAGPREKGMVATLPAGARLRAVYLQGETVVVDFAATLAGEHPGGSWSETLTVYSVVNSVAANLPGVTRVQLLLEGRQGESVAGHLSLDRPLAPRPSLLDGKF